MKYKVGDKVRVKEYQQEADFLTQQGDDEIAENYKKTVGKVGVITNIIDFRVDVLPPYDVRIEGMKENEHGEDFQYFEDELESAEEVVN